jgi:hypothetical protein
MRTRGGSGLIPGALAQETVTPQGRASSLWVQGLYSTENNRALFSLAGMSAPRPGYGHHFSMTCLPSCCPQTDCIIPFINICCPSNGCFATVTQQRVYTLHYFSAFWGRQGLNQRQILKVVAARSSRTVFKNKVRCSECFSERARESERKRERETRP